MAKASLELAKRVCPHTSSSSSSSSPADPAVLVVVGMRVPLLKYRSPADRAGRVLRKPRVDTLHVKAVLLYGARKEPHILPLLELAEAANARRIIRGRSAADCCDVLGAPKLDDLRRLFDLLLAGALVTGGSRDVGGENDVDGEDRDRQAAEEAADEARKAEKHEHLDNDQRDDHAVHRRVRARAAVHSTGHVSGEVVVPDGGNQDASSG